MELRGIFGRSWHFWEIRRTNCRDGRITTIGTMAQLVLHMAEMNSQCSSLGLQLLIVFFESVVVLSQLVDVEVVVI